MEIYGYPYMKEHDFHEYFMWLLYVNSVLILSLYKIICVDL